VSIGEFNVGAIGQEPAGATPIDDEDMAGLIPTHVATRADLNQVEYENIARALPWAKGRAQTGRPTDLLESRFLYALHKHMFSDVWRWAGTQRRRETNLGVDPGAIGEQLAIFFADARYWHDYEIFEPDELAVRIHYRLVCIHPFPNGNGRCTRLISDLYRISMQLPSFTWGAARLDSPGAARDAYIAALVAAPTDDCASLISFAKS
jgi:Fic-DOC domain mobile mystery protein B